VEKGVELEMRKFIEEHVSEAMIRKCPRCTQVDYPSIERQENFVCLFVFSVFIKSKDVIK
jgi:hypothetical protein